MKTKFVIILSLALIGVSFTITGKKNDSNESIKIKWVKNVKGDFSFKEKWNYPEYVYKNSFGQLSCDGDCPIGIDGMKDENGKIYMDSLSAFYKLVDTTHQFYSLESEVLVYEYSGINFIDFKRSKNGNIYGKSLSNVSTHSQLIIELKKDFCNVSVYFNSIRDLGQHTFNLESGTIKIDENLFKEGVIKAVFIFKFKNTLDPNQELSWKGKIYSKIENE